MLVELLGGRLISPFFGSSIYVWGSVIFVFMLGLALGSPGSAASIRAAGQPWPRLAGLLVLRRLGLMVFLADPDAELAVRPGAGPARRIACCPVSASI